MKNLEVKVTSAASRDFLLPFGGSNGKGKTLGVNTSYFLKDTKPWYPVMGEFHYSRYPVQYWEESLCKIRAGGIQIVSSYIFWIYHEEEKGKWDFSGQRDLRKFIELCSSLNLKVFLRIGPWAHGECRNGGFPDWLQNDSSIKLRSNDPVYLEYTRNFYENIFEATKGFLWKDGGPVIGIQIENEYGHVGGKTGSEGLKHILTLKKMAIDIGFDVPFYTATGWGGANVVDGEMLPVQGGYVDAPWEKHTNELPANENFLLLPFNSDSQEVFTFNVENNPYLAAELGGGIQITTHRRPIISADDTAAMALCKLATGANLLGYYMYHGGTHPVGKFSTMQETTATGSYSDLPVLTYDFQGCIGEYGELHLSYRKLKKLHIFLESFGDLIAPSNCFFPAEIVRDAEDTNTLRLCVRHDNKTNSGFLFVNNYQRRRKMKNHKDVNISIKLSNETVIFPMMYISTGFYGVFPFNIKLGNALLKSTNAKLLCKFGNRYVFYCHEKPVFNFEGEIIDMIVLTEEEADDVWLFGDRLFITKGNLYEKDEKIFLTTCRTQETVEYYLMDSDKKSIVYNFNPVSVNCSFNVILKNDIYAEYEILTDEIPADTINEMFLNIDFTGDRAELYMDDAMIADWYTTGLPWRIGLHRFNYNRRFTFKVFPVTQDTYFECELKEGYFLNSISLEAQYKTFIGSE